MQFIHSNKGYYFSMYNFLSAHFLRKGISRSQPCIIDSLLIVYIIIHEKSIIESNLGTHDCYKTVYNSFITKKNNIRREREQKKAKYVHSSRNQVF